jgi:PadR family transcriptional regulator, regulatory protein PadR
MDLLRGTLDLLILNAVRDGPLHGYGIARAIEQSTRAVLRVQEGVLYPSLRKLESRGLLGAEWGITESGRNARFYALTGKGRAQLRQQERGWRAYVRAMDLALRKV